MTVTSAFSSFGTLLQMGDGATPEAFTTIAEVGDIAGPALSSDTAEATNHSSTDGMEEVVPTILRTGQVTFPINFVPTAVTQGYTAGLLYHWKQRTKKNWKLIFPDGSSTTWQFAAFIVGFAPKAPVNGILSADITLKVTGSPTLA